MHIYWNAPLEDEKSSQQRNDDIIHLGYLKQMTQITFNIVVQQKNIFQQTIENHTAIEYKLWARNVAINSLDCEPKFVLMLIIFRRGREYSSSCYFAPSAGQLSSWCPGSKLCCYNELHVTCYQCKIPISMQLLLTFCTP